ncbi:uncharacterized protein V6R79_014159 [Siganus canaliculatus]
MDASVRTFLLLCCFHAGSVRSDGFALGPVELAPIPCNDKAVEKLSRLAVTYINEDRADGYKFALNRVANVHLHAQGPAGNVYYLDLDVLETKCHVGSPKPWKRCDVRPFMETQISGNCNTTILHTPDGYTFLYSYDCFLVPDSPDKLQLTCPTCPLLLPEDSEQAVNAARLALAAYKRKSILSGGLGVKRITRAAAQVVPVKANFVEFTVQQCPEGTTGTGTCQRLTPGPDTETAGFCTGSVFGDFDLHPDVQVSCEMFKVQYVDHLRPLQPQGHDLPVVPTFSPVVTDPGNDPQTVPAEPTQTPAAAVEPAPTDPSPTHPLPLDPSFVLNFSDPLSSSSSESAEGLANLRPPRPSAAAPFDSSSEEVEGLVALRPPFGFRYQRRERRRRQASVGTPSSHQPTFLADFPSGPSPFRSCPGPSRYTTV